MKLTINGKKIRSDWLNKTTVKRQALMKTRTKQIRNLPTCQFSTKMRQNRSLTMIIRSLKYQRTVNQMSTMTGSWTKMKNFNRLINLMPLKKLPDEYLSCETCAQ